MDYTIATQDAIVRDVHDRVSVCLSAIKLIHERFQTPDHPTVNLLFCIIEKQLLELQDDLYSAMLYPVVTNPQHFDEWGDPYKQTQSFSQSLTPSLEYSDAARARLCAAAR